LTSPSNRIMKTLLLITTLALSANVQAYCSFDDHECAAQEAERDQMERDIQEQRNDFEQLQRDLDRERREQERDSQQRENNQRETRGGAYDILCDRNKADCN
jgi:hypothetical protein